MAEGQHQIDFNSLARELLNKAPSILFDWLPGGKMVGNEFECGNLSGVAGRSLRVNIRSGKWSDFAADLSGGDLISLYAAIHRLSQVDAAKKLSGLSPSDARKTDAPTPSMANGNGHHHHPPSQDDKPVLIPPPKGTKKPNFTHRKMGDPVQVWTYKDGLGAVLYFVARYKDPTDGSKQFLPYSWSSEGKWVLKAWPEPRPLYGLESLASHPKRPVLVVEGEKAADAAAQIVGSVYSVVTWQGGSKAWKKTDLTPLHNKKLLLWPDADDPGIRCMNELAMFLVEQSPEIKMLDVQNMPSGWDSADALADGMSWKEFKEWAAPKAHKYAVMQTSVEKRSAADPQESVDLYSHLPDGKSVKVEVLPGAESPPQISIHVSTDESTPEAPVSLHAAWESLHLAMTQKAGPIINVDNVVRVLDGWPPLKDCLWFDEFHQRVLTNKDHDGKVREWLDVDDIDLTVYLQRVLGMPKMTERVVRSGVELFAFRNKRNEPRDWMESLKWDGSKRLEHFFAQAFGAEDNEYTTAASRNWWIAMAARVYQPGCKFDNMVVLEGNQGKFKSTALDIIGGQWFMEATETIGSKDFLQSLNGKLLIEIAELDSFSKADIRTIKKTISCRVDTYRASFGRRAKDFKRSCVFVGSTNEDEYLEDQTGGRRFWPIKTGDIDLDMIRKHRDQLFAEAVAMFKAREAWWVMPKLAADVQESRRRSDAWEDPVLVYLSGREKVKLSEVAVDGLDFDHSHFDKRSQMRLAGVMKTLGWKKAQAWVSGRAEKVWVRTELAATILPTSKAQPMQQRSMFDQHPGIRNHAPGAEQ